MPCACGPQTRSTSLSLPRQSTKASVSQDVRAAVQVFVDRYQRRFDLAAFLTLYADEVVFHDHRLNVTVEGRDALGEFLDWGNPEFELQDPSAGTLTVDEVEVEGRRAELRGSFLPFRWRGESYGTMSFRIQLRFDEELRIVRQDDWIEYPPGLLGVESTAGV